VAFWDGWSDEDRRTGKRIVIGLGITLAVLMFVFWQTDRRIESERQQTAPWAEMARAAAMGQPRPTEALDPQGGYITGRVLPVDSKRREVASLHFELPTGLRSQKPEDVGTVLLLTDGEKRVGQYEGGAPAYVRTVNVQVIDRARNAVIARVAIDGGRPPQTVVGSQPGYGPPPVREVVTYLSALPRR
jgi:hypothetical protein